MASYKNGDDVKTGVVARNDEGQYGIIDLEDFSNSSSGKSFPADWHPVRIIVERSNYSDGQSRDILPPIDNALPKAVQQKLQIGQFSPKAVLARRAEKSQSGQLNGGRHSNREVTGNENNSHANSRGKDFQSVRNG